MKRKMMAGGFAAGVPGIVAVSVLLLPSLLAGKPLAAPMWAVQLFASLQSALLLAVAVCIGVCLAPRVGLRAPLLSAWASRTPPGQALKTALAYGLAGGILGTLGLLLAGRAAPAQMRVDTPIPLLVRVLYGGITEELLLRWGFMSLVAWVLWRLLQKRAPTPSAAVIVASILASAFMFGAGHLPAAASLAGHLTPAIVAYVVIGNAVFGIIAGWLYWKAGLEAAVCAHVTAHLGLMLFAMT